MPTRKLVFVLAGADANVEVWLMIGWKLGDRLKTAFHIYAQLATFGHSLGLAFPLLVLAVAYV